MKHSLPVVVLLLCTLSHGGPIAAQALPIPTVHFSSVSGHPTAALPGMPGVEFKPSPTSGTFQNLPFERIYGSAGGHYAFKARAALPANSEDIIILDGQVVAQEGAAVPGIAGTFYGEFEIQLGVSEFGEVSFATSTSGPSSLGESMFKVDVLGNLTVIAQYSNPVPFLPAGVQHDGYLFNPVLMANGTPGYATRVNGPGYSSGNNHLLALNGAMIARQGVTIPTSQSGGANLAWGGFNETEYYTSGDGAHWMAKGILTNGVDIVVVDGVTVLQEGAIIPGSGFWTPIGPNKIRGIHMDQGGGWMAWGGNTSGIGWVLRNGEAVAITSTPIISGSTEIWHSSYNAWGYAVANTHGDYVICGATNAPAGQELVLVLNNTHLIARRGDPVDLDGNGLFDDDSYIKTIYKSAHLTDSGILYYLIGIKDGLGTVKGNAICSIALPLTHLEACAAGTISATGVHNTLKVNGFFGGGSRRVSIPVGHALTLDLAAPPGSAAAEFVLLGYLGIPGSAEVFPLPGVGSLCFAPCLIPSLAPGQPVVTIASSVPIASLCPGLLAGPAPWSLSFPGGVPIPFQITAQAVVISSSGADISNAVVLTIY